MRYLYTALIVVGLFAFRMILGPNAAWFYLPKRWQRWLFDGPTPRKISR